MVFSLHLSNDDAAYWWRRIHGVHRQHSGGENWEPEFERVWDQFWTAVRDKLPKELRSAPLFGKALPWQGAQGHHYRHRYPDEPFGYATKASSLTPRYVIAKFERILYQYLDNIDQFDLCEFLMNLGKDWPHRIRVSYVLWRFPKLRALLKTAAYSSDQDTPSRQVSEAFGIQNPQGLTYAQLIATAVGHTNRTTIEKARENDERTRVEALLAQKDQSQECRDMVISAMQQVWATCSPTNLNHPTACFVCFESMPVAIRQIGHWLMCGDCKNKFMTSHHTLSIDYPRNFEKVMKLT